MVKCEAYALILKPYVCILSLYPLRAQWKGLNLEPQSPKSIYTLYPTLNPKPTYNPYSQVLISVTTSSSSRYSLDSVEAVVTQEIRTLAPLKGFRVYGLGE